MSRNEADPLGAGGATALVGVPRSMRAGTAPHVVLANRPAMQKLNVVSGRGPLPTLARPRSCCAGCNARDLLVDTPGVGLDSMSEAQLERLYAGLTRLASLPEKELHGLVTSLMAEEQDA
jgi:hypothetical protein